MAQIADVQKKLQMRRNQQKSQMQDAIVEQQKCNSQIDQLEDFYADNGLKMPRQGSV